MTEADFGGIKVGPDHPVRVIAELGICHRGDVELAKKMASYAADAGADFIKFEIYQLETALTEPYREDTTITFSSLDGEEIERNLFELFKDGHLSFDEAEELINHLETLDVPFFATVSTIEQADFMMENGACGVKLSSGEVNHIPLIDHIAERSIPAFVDIAKTYQWEVMRVAEQYASSGGENLVILHNPAGYPAPPELIDLDRIDVLKEGFDVPIGFTDHSPGRQVIAAAMGKGACAVEKPISPDKTLPYIEHAFSENMEDFRSFVDDVRYLDKAMGQAHRKWDATEMEDNLVNRAGICASRDLKEGTTLSEDDVMIARPGYGISPESIDDIPGRVLKTSLEKGECLKWEYL